MNVNEWIEKNYNNIPKGKQAYYSSKIVAAVCYYKYVNKIFPICTTEDAAVAFVEEIIRKEGVATVPPPVNVIQPKQSLTEKSLKHQMKRNLPDNTIVDIVFEKCAEYLKTEGKLQTDETKEEAVSNILKESGIVQSEAVKNIGEKIIQQQKQALVEKPKHVVKPRTEYKEIIHYKFFTAEEVQRVKKRSTTLAKNPEIQITKEMILKIVEEVIKIIEEIKEE